MHIPTSRGTRFRLLSIGRISRLEGRSDWASLLESSSGQLHARPFERLLATHSVIRASRLGWGHLANGALLTAAELAGFDAMITVDQNMPFQQNMSARRIALVAIASPSNDIQTLSALTDAIKDGLTKALPGTVVTVGGSSESS